ncbi:MAG: Uma2 family endonuclease [Spirulinaceae cyanobacterium]
MTLALDRYSFQDYLQHSDGTDTRYELVQGELVAMGQPQGIHGAIVDYLYDAFRTEIRSQQQPWTVKQMAIAIPSPRGGRWETARVPDLMVLAAEQWRAMRNREAVLYLNEPPPELVVEVVSDSTRSTDYRAKRVEYNILNITEYWLVDPAAATVTVFQLVDELYESQQYQGSEAIASQVFPELSLRVAEILTAE